MNSFLQPFLKLCSTKADTENAFSMKKYMKGQFEFYGIKSPVRKEISKVFLKTYGYPVSEEIESIVKDTWDLPQRELQYFTMEMLGRLVKKGAPDRIELYEYLITNKSWWDTVDYIASNLVGVHFQKYPEQILPRTKSWMDSGNIWLHRTALLFQLKYKKDTDLNLLSEYINQLKGSKEFFINKAIGWMLREYSKTDADWVIDFVNTNELAPLSKREALKWLERKDIKTTTDGHK